MDDIPLLAAGSNRVKPLSTMLLAWAGSFLQWFLADPSTKCSAGPVLGVGPEGVLSPIGTENPFFPDEGNEFPEGSEFEEQRILRRCGTFLGRDQCYYYYIPECASGPTAFVLDLHAWSFCPSATMVWSGYRELSEEKCFGVMWPTGDMDSIIPFGFPTWGGRDDYDRAREMVVDFEGHIAQQNSGVTVNTKRFYTTGLSNGCQAAITFAMYHSDLIAAVACIGGGWVTTPDPNFIATPIMAFHGKKDILVPYNGVGDSIPSFRDAFEGLSSLNNCTTETTQEYPLPEMDIGGEEGVEEGGVTIWTSTECDGDVEVKYVTFETGGHIVIGGLKEITPGGGFAFSTPVDTTLMSWNFMNRFELELEPSGFPV